MDEATVGVCQMLTKRNMFYLMQPHTGMLLVFRKHTGLVS